MLKPATAFPIVFLFIAACSAAKREEPPSIPSGESATPPPTTAAASESPSAAAVSRYTSLEKCTLVESNEDEDWSTSQCPGLGGIELKLNYADGREDLELVRPGKPNAALGLNRGGFNSFGQTIEWREKLGPNGLFPAMLIVRNTETDGSGSSVGNLLVIDLAKSCVVAKVAPGPQQNAQAREIADAAPRACRS